MEVKREKLTDAVLLEVTGSVDIYSSPVLRGELKAALEKRSPRIVVDLRAVTFVDSSGLATLIEALQRVNEYQGKLFLCNLAPAVLGVFQLANLDNIFTISPTREAALGG
ncbi:MAG: STAS domain-containing protein [Planctomycetota bacterium]